MINIIEEGSTRVSGVISSDNEEQASERESTLKAGLSSLPYNVLSSDIGIHYAN